MSRVVFHLDVCLMTSLKTAFDGLAASPRMPVLFVGHGNPMNAIEDNDYSRSWRALGEQLPVPSAILCVSAHWMTRGTTLVNVTARPETIHDFGGFPRQLFEQQYPAPGAPDAAAVAVELLRHHHAEASEEWGLDHGAWSVLIRMFPRADIPVFQLSLDLTKAPQAHFDLARDLRALREKGVMIIGSGNVVHNLMALNPGAPPCDWAEAFDGFVAEKLAAGDHKAIVNAYGLGRVTKLAHPTPEHFFPILYALGAAGPDEKLTSFNETFDLGSVSMRSFMLA
jgi:4,5-DOPA dioxygenase extradiol